MKLINTKQADTYLADALGRLYDVVTHDWRVKLGHRVEDIDSRFHDDAVLVGQHPLQGGHEAVVTKFRVEGRPILELEGERVSANLLKEVGQLSVSFLWYGLVLELCEEQLEKPTIVLKREKERWTEGKRKI